MTCAISWLSTEDNSEVSLASATRPAQAEGGGPCFVRAGVHDASNQPLDPRSDWNRRSHPCFAPDPNENRCPVFESSAISRPAPQPAPPGTARSVVLPATRQRR